jgi:glycosyltransferase involved in cell wall biosynthesis
MSYNGIATGSAAKPLVSIILNYFEKKSTIFDVLDSLEKQELSRCAPRDIEIIVIDDGTDGEDTRHKLPSHVTYVWQHKNGYGIARAKNTGAKLAAGRYLLFMDSDVLAGRHLIDAMLEGFDRYGDHIVQSGYIWDYFFPGAFDPRTEFGVWENPNRPTRRFYQIAGTALAIASDVFRRTPGYDESLTYGGVEDLLFGYQYGRLPEAAVFFNRKMECWHIPHGPSLAHANIEKNWEIVRSKFPDFYDEYIVQGLR